MITFIIWSNLEYNHMESTSYNCMTNAKQFQVMTEGFVQNMSKVA